MDLCYLCNMSKLLSAATALNIRNFPRDLLRQCKIRALERDLPLREFVIEALRHSVGRVSRLKKR